MGIKEIRYLSLNAISKLADEYYYRLENIFDYWANELEFDWQKINEQLDDLYSKIHEE